MLFYYLSPATETSSSKRRTVVVDVVMQLWINWTFARRTNNNWALISFYLQEKTTKTIFYRLIRYLHYKRKEKHMKIHGKCLNLLFFQTNSLMMDYLKENSEQMIIKMLVFCCLMLYFPNRNLFIDIYMYMSTCVSAPMLYCTSLCSPLSLFIFRIQFFLLFILLN